MTGATSDAALGRASRDCGPGKRKRPEGGLERAVTLYLVEAVDFGLLEEGEGYDTHVGAGGGGYVLYS